MSPTDFGSAKLTSMHDESFFAKLAVFDGQPRFTVVLPHFSRTIEKPVFLVDSLVNRQKIATDGH